MSCYFLCAIVLISVCSINANNINENIDEKYRLSSHKIHSFTKNSEITMQSFTKNLKSVFSDDITKETPKECSQYEGKINAIFDQCAANVEKCHDNAKNGIINSIENIQPTRERISEISKNLMERLTRCDNLFEAESPEYFQCYVDNFDQNLYDFDVISSLSQTSLIILNNNFTSIENEAIMCINEATMESKLNMTMTINDFHQCILENINKTESSEVIDTTQNNVEEISTVDPNENSTAETDDKEIIMDPSNGCNDVKVCPENQFTDLTKELHFVPLNNIEPTSESSIESTDINQQTDDQLKESVEVNDNNEEDILNSIEMNTKSDKYPKNQIFNLLFNKDLILIK